MAFRTLFILILCNIMWSAHPLMGKYLLEAFSPPQAAWLRYTSAFASYIVAVVVLKRFPVSRGLFAGEPFMRPRGKRELALILAVGFSAFCFSPLLQLAGLEASRATDNAVIIALEPLITVMLAWLVLHERPTRLHFISFAMALLGFGFLTGLTPAAFIVVPDPHSVGNIMLLLSLLGEGMYSAVGRKLVQWHRPASVFGAAIAVGAISLTIAVALFWSFPTLDQLTHMPLRSALSLLWLGPFGTAFSYLYWMTALQKAPVATIALTLFVQPILGPVWGALFLGERLTTPQALGGGLILVAVFGQTWLETRRPRSV